LPRKGCSFEPRCALRMDVCRAYEPPLVKLGELHFVSCYKYKE
jgi:ABC-type dipeptide/oligopeptide/nickel transport system ATPase component